jgi:hypothetical protein
MARRTEKEQNRRDRIALHVAGESSQPENGRPGEDAKLRRST